VELKGGLEGLRPKPRRTAVIVAHGMGQQVRFETIDAVARRLLDRVRAAAPQILTRFVKMGKGSLGRAEISFSEGVVRHEVHLYEAYWSPLTEGQIGLKEVVRWFAGAGVSGLKQSLCGGLERRVLGKFHRYPAPRHLALVYLLALLLFLSLTLIFATIGAVAASRAIQGTTSDWPSEELTADFTGDLALMLVGLVSLVLLPVRKLPSWLRWTPVIVAGAAILGCGTLLAIHQLGRHDQVSWLIPHFHGLTDWLDLRLGTIVAAIVTTGIWGLAGAINLGARTFALGFLGDVAIYLSGSTVSKYDDLRDRIQKVGLNVGQAVYGARDAKGDFLYHQVVVVGHSLGSVIAYDMLNALIREDGLSGSGLRVAGRTALFITFGSPLDKTAYILGSRRPADAPIREALATEWQPMLASYALRPAWVNLWSPNDVISGPLGYYDPPGVSAERSPANTAAAPGGPVVNIVDPDARTPLMGQPAPRRAHPQGDHRVAAATHRAHGPSVPAPASGGRGRRRPPRPSPSP
jgi:hypothetical protein